MTASLIYDFFWLLINLADWSEISPLEGPSLSLRRKISIIASFVVLLTKIILCFSGWRCSIVHKIKVSNPFKKSNDVAKAKSRIRDVRYQAEPEQEEAPKKKKRPVINYETSKEIHLRFTDSVL